ncbi:MAG: DUF4199 domain-containing protein [Verrucomicrobiota bacterium]
MKIPLTYGAFIALGGALLTLVLYFLGFHDSAEKLQTAQWVGGGIGFILTITLLLLAMREKRARFSVNEDWGYGNALGVGILTGLVGSVLGAIFYYVYASQINPDLSEHILQAQRQAMEAKGMSAAKFEQAEPMMRKFMTPGFTAAMQCLMAIVLSVLLSLILAIFVRQRPTPPVGVPPAL